MGETRRDIHIEVTPDGMAATVTVGPGPALTPEVLGEALASVGVVFGSDAEALARVAAELRDPAAIVERHPIARGVPPRDGQAGAFEPAFAEGPSPGHLREDGTMDYHDRELLKPARRGDVVGFLREETAGVDGCTVEGRPLPARAGPPAPVALGPGVARGEGGKVIALRDGVLSYVQGRTVDVVEHHAHEGDVDLRSGSLVMQGSLTIRGAVLRGFSVEATRDVDIQGDIEGGTVRAGGMLRVSGGLRGSDTSVVEAGGDLRGRHAEGALLRSFALLVLQDAMNCDLGAVEIRIAGTLRGGVTMAERSVTVQTAAVSHGTAETVLAAGVPLDRDLTLARRGLCAARVARGLVRASRGPPRAGSAQPRNGRLARGLASLTREAGAARLAYAERRAELSLSAFVEVRTTAPAGTVIAVGEVRRVLETEVRAVRFSKDPEAHTLRMEGVRP